jgi:dihydroorotate dehydrogenase (fumarate)
MDLTTRYMGLELNNPLVASASPLNAAIGNLRQLEDAGAGAGVLPSLFEEQIEAEAARYDHLTSASAESFAEALSYFPAPAEYKVGPHAYLDLVRRASEAVDIPVIASLNGTTDEGWISYARSIEEAGAKGLELNIYFIPADLSLTGAQVERRYLDILRHVRATVSIPVAVKLSPYFSAVGNMALALEGAGADALVLFSRFYQPDIDLGQLRLLTDLQLSQPNEIRLPLLWLAVLSGRVKASLAATTGVATADEVIKYLLVGADVVMTTSALLRHGLGHVAVLLQGLEAWLAAREFSSLHQVRGVMSQQKLQDPQAFERANYIKILQGYRG